MDIVFVFGVIGNDDVEMRYQFENFNDFLEFLKKNKEIAGKKRIAWVESVDYNRYMKSGCRYFESGNYGKALEEYQKARKCKPIAISAVFEIAECYICLGEVWRARRLLLENVDKFTKAKEMARFYDRMGNIALEQEKYNLALSNFLMSGCYEECVLAKKAVIHISWKKGLYFKDEDWEREIPINDLSMIDEHNSDINSNPEETKV